MTAEKVEEWLEHTAEHALHPDAKIVLENARKQFTRGIQAMILGAMEDGE
jgi:hypothetical protein